MILLSFPCPLGFQLYVDRALLRVKEDNFSSVLVCMASLLSRGQKAFSNSCGKKVDWLAGRSMMQLNENHHQIGFPVRSIGSSLPEPRRFEMRRSMGSKLASWIR